MAMGILVGPDTCIAAFARMMLTLLISHLTKIWPRVNEFASEPNKTSGKPILEQHGTKDNSTAPPIKKNKKNKKNSTARTARSKEQSAFTNGGNQNIRGFTNQTGIVTGDRNGAIKGGGRPRESTKAQPNCPKANSSDPKAQSVEKSYTFLNDGNQNIKGFTNQTGIITGNGNGKIEGFSAQELSILFGALSSSADGTTQNGSPTTPPTYHPTPMPGMYYNNNGGQRKTGLTNQTGIIVGKDNGTIDSRGD